MKIGTSVKQLKGHGLELLISNEGDVRAEFYDGNFVRALKTVSKEDGEKSTVPVTKELDPETKRRLDLLLADYMDSQ